MYASPHDCSSIAREFCVSDITCNHHYVKIISFAILAPSGYAKTILFYGQIRRIWHIVVFFGALLLFWPLAFVICLPTEREACLTAAWENVQIVKVVYAKFLPLVQSLEYLSIRSGLPKLGW